MIWVVRDYKEVAPIILSVDEAAEVRLSVCVHGVVHCSCASASSAAHQFVCGRSSNSVYVFVYGWQGEFVGNASVQEKFAKASITLLRVHACMKCFVHMTDKKVSPPQ
jgi:hypothetical protein